MEVSILFAEKDGPYSKVSNVDIWDISRDARGYNGNNPCVAHPPCQLWGRFAIINYKRWGGEHNKPKNDGGCFKSALDNVRRCGGVLEHPALTYAWVEYGLKKPQGNFWVKIAEKEWVCQVYQSAYGHLANKKTWLFYCGGIEPFGLKWGKKEGTHQIGFYDQRGKSRNKPTISGKKASETPEEFRDELIKLAIHSRHLI